MNQHDDNAGSFPVFRLVSLIGETAHIQNAGHTGHVPLFLGWLKKQPNYPFSFGFEFSILKQLFAMDHLGRSFSG